ncbi:MAG: NAD-dependent dehydratase, partial [Bacteroidetes bacterium]|nr:NAD-dependent dehydratase [Bacteroidota bacterium]
KKPVFIKIPCFILILIGAFGNLLKFLGIENETTLTNMRILCVDNYYTNKKTKVALNIKFNGIDEAIGDAIKWFKTNGVIK